MTVTKKTPITIFALKGITEAAEFGPHLLDANQPAIHRDVTRETVSIEDLLTPFAGKKPGLAFRVHHNNDAKTVDGGVADAIVAASSRPRRLVATSRPGSRHQEDMPPRTSRRANPLENVRTTRPGSTSPATRVTNGATTWPRNRTRVAGA